MKFSPFYPHYDIPVPGLGQVTAACVEGVWQGLKIFPSEGYSFKTLKNDSMKNLKRKGKEIVDNTNESPENESSEKESPKKKTKQYEKCIGHKYGNEVLGYVEARKLIYIPTYNWVLENRLQSSVKKLKSLSSQKTVVLLDYETNENVENTSKPLSHASLIKAYVESLPEQAEAPVYKNGMKVRHAKFGDGKVVSMDVENERVVVAFDEVGEKMLSTSVAKLEII